MTKRFTIEILDKNNWLIEDTKTGETANPIDGTTNVLKGLISTLNKFNDENKQLKKDNKEYIRGLDLAKATSQSWASDVRELREQNCQLEKENERLKNKIDVLEDDNETYHKSLEQLNLYTKRFIPTKCTNEFKDCKTNRYYWLDHEGNFEGCLELLNLLDCENERLKFENRELKGSLIEYEEQIKR